MISLPSIFAGFLFMIVGGDARTFSTAGAVVISKDGMAITNYHVESMGKSKLMGMTSDGKCHRVIELIAGNRDRDVALIRLEGTDFTPVKIAVQAPNAGDDIIMMHHSENRFYTYDRGYVMRHPKIGDHPWMEISADYAPGGSGCGIFNKDHELVGLVSIIQYGDGPSLAEEMNMDESNFEEPLDDDASIVDMGLLLVKHAVPLSAIQGLWDDSATENAKTTKTRQLSHDKPAPVVVP